MKAIYVILLLFTLSGSAQNKTFVPDGYVLSDEMIYSNYTGFDNAKRFDGIVCAEKSWFRNKALGEALVFEYYTDWHRLLSWHFYTKDIPIDLAETFTMYLENGEYAPQRQVNETLPKYLDLSKNLETKYFTTIKGLKLGDPKSKVLEIYKSKPDSITTRDGIEKYVWSFPGDILVAEGKTAPEDRPLALDSFGHTATFFFRKEKLIGIILYNDIP